MSHDDWVLLLDAIRLAGFLYLWVLAIIVSLKLFR